MNEKSYRSIVSFFTDSLCVKNNTVDVNNPKNCILLENRFRTSLELSYRLSDTFSLCDGITFSPVFPKGSYPHFSVILSVHGWNPQLFLRTVWNPKGSRNQFFRDFLGVTFGILGIIRFWKQILSINFSKKNTNIELELSKIFDMLDDFDSSWIMDVFIRFNIRINRKYSKK